MSYTRTHARSHARTLSLSLSLSVRKKELRCVVRFEVSIAVAMMVEDTDFLKCDAIHYNR